MKSDKQLITTTCPDCEEPIELELDIAEGDNLTCPECWAYLRVVGLNPLELAWDMQELEEDLD